MTTETVHAPERRRALLVPIASLLAHFALVAGWLLVSGSPPPPSAPPRLPRPALRLALVHTAPGPEAPPPPPEADPERTRFDWIAVNRARPDVVVAWNLEEVAYSRDDGASFAIARLPRSTGQRWVTGNKGVVTSSGGVLVEIDRHTWWRTPDGRAGASEGSAFPGEVRVWASDAERTLAVVAHDDGSERFFVSTDDARTWTEGPQPPREVYDLDVRPGGRVVASWAWSAACGGGGEGHASWSTGRAQWAESPATWIGTLGADDWIYLSESQPGAIGHLVTGHGPGERIALGPRVPEGAEAWVATDGRSTYLGAGQLVVSARGGVFSPYDLAAPEGLRDVQVDGRGRLVAVSRRGVVRREGEGVWRELPVPATTMPAPAP